MEGRDHYREATQEELETLVKAREIVKWVQQLDGDSDLQHCEETLGLLIEDMSTKMFGGDA